MKENILNFIKSQRIVVLAVPNLDGSPHAAIMHFAHSDEPLQFIILTAHDSKKCKNLVENGTCKASLVLGTSEAEMKTMQLDGDLTFTEDTALMDAYFAKFPEKWEKYSPGGHDTFLIFTPTWWKFSDYKNPDPTHRITESN